MSLTQHTNFYLMDSFRIIATFMFLSIVNKVNGYQDPLKRTSNTRVTNTIDTIITQLGKDDTRFPPSSFREKKMY